MMNNKFSIRVIAVIMALAMITAMTGCGKSSIGESDPTDPSDVTVTYSVKIRNAAGTAINKCSVTVYSNADMTTVVHKGVTNDAGEVSFTAAGSDEYVAVISKVPAGYKVDEHYPIDGENFEIVLVPDVMTDEDMNSLRLQLGDAMKDFSLTMEDGSQLTLSQLLQQKKVVVLNLWYLNCQPCKMEFPHIQQALDQVREDVAFIAMNPVGDTQAEITNFKNQNGYTFDMIACDTRWKDIWKNEPIAYPTTVIIDRYGNICLIHTGTLSNAQEFLDMVNYFIADDYQQKFFKSPGQIPKAQ